MLVEPGAAIVVGESHPDADLWNAADSFSELHERVQQAYEQGCELHSLSASTRSYAALFAASSAAMEAQQQRLAAIPTAAATAIAPSQAVATDGSALAHREPNESPLHQVVMEEPQSHTPAAASWSSPAPSTTRGDGVRGTSHSPVTPPSLDIVGLSETSRAALAAMSKAPSAASTFGFDGSSSAIASYYGSSSLHPRHTVSALPHHRHLAADASHTIDGARVAAPQPQPQPQPQPSVPVSAPDSSAVDAGAASSAAPPALRVPDIEAAEFSTLPTFLSTQLSLEVSIDCANATVIVAPARSIG